MLCLICVYIFIYMYRLYCICYVNLCMCMFDIYTYIYISYRFPIALHLGVSQRESCILMMIASSWRRGKDKLLACTWRFTTTQVVTGTTGLKKKNWPRRVTFPKHGVVHRCAHGRTHKLLEINCFSCLWIFTKNA